jgi:hypothetical protein
MLDLIRLGRLALYVGAPGLVACSQAGTSSRRQAADSGTVMAALPTKPQWVSAGSSWAMGIAGGVVYDLAIDESGNIYVLGSSNGDVALTPDVTLPAAKEGVFIAKFDSAGRYLWGRSFGNDDAVSCYGMTLAPSNELLVGCMVQAATTVLGQELPEPNQRDVLLLKLTSDGDLQWQRSLGGEKWQQAAQVAVDADGSVYVAGTTSGTLDLGGGPLPISGSNNAFFAKLDATGAHVFSRVFGGAGFQSPDSIAMAANGDVILAGRFSGEIDFGAGPLTAWGFDTYNLFVTRFTSGGEPIWVRRIASAYGWNAQVASLPSDQLTLCGSFTESIQLGDTWYAEDAGSTQGDNGFFAWLDASGNLTSRRVFGAAWIDECNDLGVTQDGEVVATGDFVDVINLGGNDIGQMGRYGSLYVRYDDQGNHRASQAFVSDGRTVGTAIAALPPDRVALAGYMLQKEPLDVGFAQLTNIDGYIVVIPQ